MPKTTKIRKYKKRTQKKRTQKGGNINNVRNLLNEANLPQNVSQHTEGQYPRITHYETSYQPVINARIAALQPQLLGVTPNEFLALDEQLEMIQEQIAVNTPRAVNEVTLEEDQALAPPPIGPGGFPPPIGLVRMGRSYHNLPPGPRLLLRYYEAMEPLVTVRLNFLRPLYQQIVAADIAAVGHPDDHAQEIAGFLGGKKTKKTKKVRKHKGIVQSGGNTGRLRKGYRYSGKKLKSGLPQIIKCKSKKC